MKPHANRVRIILSTAVISIITIAGSAARAQSNPCHLVENWAKLPQGRKFGAVIGVAVDRGGNVWAFDRCGGDTCSGSKLAPILKFDSSGRLVNSFGAGRSEEHTSELQSLTNLVCRLLLEKKNKDKPHT